MAFSSDSLLLSSLEMSDTDVYEPSIRARLGTAAHFCQVLVLKLPILARSQTSLLLCRLEREGCNLQEHLAHKKQRPPRTLQ